MTVWRSSHVSFRALGPCRDDADSVPMRPSSDVAVSRSATFRGGFVGDAGDGVVDAADLLDDAADRVLRAADALDAGLHLGLGGRNELLDFTSRIAGALRQGPHFLRHDGKTTAAFAGARRLDAGIERQKVGLEGDLVDDADDLADLFGRRLDVGHGGNRLAGDLAAVLDRLAGTPTHSSRRRAISAGFGVTAIDDGGKRCHGIREGIRTAPAPSRRNCRPRRQAACDDVSAPWSA